jgi:hypothetical protein
MATTEQLVDSIAQEMASGIDTAVECWMSQVDQALTDRRLTTLGRLNAVVEVMNQYKLVTGKSELGCRRSATAADARRGMERCSKL